MRRSIAGLVAGVVSGFLLAGSAGSEELLCPTKLMPGPSLIYQRLQLHDPAGNGFGGTFNLASEPGSAKALPQGDAVTGTGIANLALRLETGSVLTPFLGAGVGTTESADRATDPTVAAPTWNDGLPNAYLLTAGVGVGCALSKNGQVDLGYRYITDNLPAPIESLGSSGVRGAENHHISINLKFLY